MRTSLNHSTHANGLGGRRHSAIVPSFTPPLLTGMEDLPGNLACRSPRSSSEVAACVVVLTRRELVRCRWPPSRTASSCSYAATDACNCSIRAAQAGSFWATLVWSKAYQCTQQNTLGRTSVCFRERSVRPRSRIRTTIIGRSANIGWVYSACAKRHTLIDIRTCRRIRRARSWIAIPFAWRALPRRVHI